MAANGLEIALDNGQVKRFVNIADISSESDLIPAQGTNDKSWIVGGRLWFDVAVEVEIRKETDTTPEPLTFDAPAQASVIDLRADDKLISNLNKKLTILGASAAKCQGFVIYATGPNPG